jgi:hypothetical protein
VDCLLHSSLCTLNWLFFALRQRFLKNGKGVSGEAVCNSQVICIAYQRVMVGALLNDVTLKDKNEQLEKERSLPHAMPLALPCV